MQPGDNLLARTNDGLAKSRKMIAVWSANYFRNGKIWTLVESFSQLHGDPLSQDRPIIPLLIEECTIPPAFRNILFIDARNKHDFDLRFRQLLQALDRPHREFDREPTLEIKEHDFEAAKRGRLAQEKGKRFEHEVAKLYELLGFTVKRDTQLHGFQIDLQSFAADTRAALEEAGVDCTTYGELLRELVPLDRYVESLIAEYETWVAGDWRGEDYRIHSSPMLFVAPATAIFHRMARSWRAVVLTKVCGCGR